MFWKSLAVISILALIGLVYSFLSFRTEINQVYLAPDPYVYTSSENFDVTIVEFSDYGCLPSKKMHALIKSAAEKDGKVRYIPRPILVSKDPVAREVFLLLYASAHQGALPLIHDKLYELWPVKDINVVKDYARSIGLDIKKLESDMRLPITARAVDLNREYFDKLQFKVTPTLMLASEYVFTRAIYTLSKEGLTTEMLLEKFHEARQWF